VSSKPAIVFVHGNPETAVVWDRLSAAMHAVRQADQIRLSPPGFGTAVPDGFEPSPDAYRDWLAAELELIGEPVDLVGHDWGGAHVVAVAMTRPELIRTWATDAIGVFHPDYVWHPLAQIWQTPGAGEQWVSDTLAAPAEQFAAALTSLGMDAGIAARIAPAFDETMGRSVLELYRHARQPAMARLGAKLPEAASRPGLALIAEDDKNVGTIAQRRAAARTAGAAAVLLPGAGHWWLTTSDQQTAIEALTRLWAAADRVTSD
jgi:pimeloyl-ACP methyl ester carboxylesterase